MFDAFNMMCDGISAVCKASEMYDRNAQVVDAIEQASHQPWVNVGDERQRQQSLMNSVIRNNRR